MKPCRLCQATTDLRESHIIPAFVYRWQKKTSATGYLRFGQKVNARVQDGLKCPFLCGECEALFNDWETTFASEFFSPYHEQGKTHFQHGEWMAKFCVSVSWRVLSYMQEKYSDVRYNNRFGSDTSEALSAWADFLLGKRPDFGPFEQHLLPFGAIDAADGSFPPNMQRYLMRAIEIDRLFGDQSAFTFAKVGHLILIGFIREPEVALWKGAKVAIGLGTIAPTTLELPDWLLKDLMDRATRLAQLRSEMSNRQNEVIEKTHRANPQRVIESETFQAWKEDQRLKNQTPPTDF